MSDMSGRPGSTGFSGPLPLLTVEFFGLQFGEGAYYMHFPTVSEKSSTVSKQAENRQQRIQL